MKLPIGLLSPAPSSYTGEASYTGQASYTGHASYTDQAPDLLIEEVGSAPPHLYRIVPRSDGVPNPTYLTVLRECGRRKKVNYAGLTRQLFVGLRKVTVEEQVERKIAGKPVLVSRIRALEEGEPVEFWSFVAHRDSCIVDVVFWHRDSDSEASDSRASGSAPPLPPERMESLAGRILDGGSGS